MDFNLIMVVDNVQKVDPNVNEDEGTVIVDVVLDVVVVNVDVVKEKVDRVEKIEAKIEVLRNVGMVIEPTVGIDEDIVAIYIDNVDFDRVVSVLINVIKAVVRIVDGVADLENKEVLILAKIVRIEVVFNVDGILVVTLGNDMGVDIKVADILETV